MILETLGSVAILLIFANLCWAQSVGGGSVQSGSSAGGGEQSGFGLGAPMPPQYMASPYFATPFSGGTRLLPSLSVIGGYDSNALYGLTSGGSDQSLFQKGSPDYFVNTTASLLLQQSSSYIEGAVQGSFSSYNYLKNKDLDFTGWNAGATAVLDKTLARLIPRSGGSLTYNYRKSQQVYAFDPSDPATNPTFDPNFNVTRGIQAARAETTTTVGTATGYYDASSAVRLRTSYSYAVNFFGVPQRGTIAIGNFFTTKSHTASLGSDVRVGPADTVGIQYQYTRTTFSANDASAENTGFFNEAFKTHGATVTWARQLSSALMASVSGGATYLLQSESAGGSGVAYQGAASIAWRPRVDTTVGINYTRGIYPSFVVGAGPAINDTVTAQVNHIFGPRFLGSVSVGYARNTTPGFSAGQNDFTFTTYQANASLSYQLFRNLSTTFTYTYGSYDQQFDQQRFQYDRHLVLIGLTTIWK
jgi:hypothetical protein